MKDRYFVYIMTNDRQTVLYVGITNDLARRAAEHKARANPGFTARYNVDKLVCWEGFADPGTAIAREKQIKGGSRRKKVALINRMNPDWRDLADNLTEIASSPALRRGPRNDG